MKVVMSSLSRGKLLEFYRKMLLMRRFDEKAGELIADGEPIYETHPVMGQEAVPVGVCAHLERGDYIVPNYRNHGHCIAMGMNVKGMMAELYGKSGGVCKGKGGPMHMADMSKGVLPGIGIVGGTIPPAVGVALAAKMKQTDRVSVCFFGDGATSIGAFHEGLNLASLWSLPVIFVCENNQYASRDPLELTSPVKDVATRASAYAIRKRTAGGNDVSEVYKAAGESIRDARKGKGPTLLEFKTFLTAPHSLNPVMYENVPKAELAKWKKKDPVQLLRGRLVKANLLTRQADEQLIAEVANQIEDAYTFARKSPYPSPKEVLEDLYA